MTININRTTFTRALLASSLAIGLAACISSQTDNAPTQATSDIYKDHVNRDVRDDIFYFVMPDRFYNGDTKNDMGDPKKPVSYGGFDPSKKSHFHGGDMMGLQEKLPYLDEMGVTAIWMTPILRNQAVQGEITGYHGYWVLDFTEIDPHLGTNQDLRNLIAAAHERGIKIYFDIITNHTADVIKFKECHGEKGDRWSLDTGPCPYKSLEQVANGDKYTIVVPEASKDIKVPAWLNDPKYYHNQGDSTWQGENSIYGDFAGLDDIDTDNPEVVKGMIEIFKNVIDELRPDGFRVDTVKHVNTEFWAEFTPAIIEHAKSLGMPNFHVFGEVYDGNPHVLSHYTTDGKMPAILDFGFQGAVYDVFVNETGTNKLQTLFDNDDLYNDGDSSADLNLNFIGNHDMGRFNHFLNNSKRDLTEKQRLDKIKLAHALTYFARGIPVVYYGDEQGFGGTGGDMASRQDMMPSKVPEFINEDLVGSEQTPADDNFNQSHPLYVYFADLAKTYKAHSALRRGVLHTRATTNDGPGIYAFSRVELDNPIEYLVVFNTAEQVKSIKLAATTDNYTDIMSKENVATNNGQVDVSVPPMSYRILKAKTPIATSRIGQLTLTDIPEKIAGDVQLGYALSAAATNPVPVFELTTELSINGGEYQKVSFDNTLPLTVQFDVHALANGTKLKVRTTATNFKNENVETVHDFVVAQ